LVFGVFTFAFLLKCSQLKQIEVSLPVSYRLPTAMFPGRLVGTMIGLIHYLSQMQQHFFQAQLETHSRIADLDLIGRGRGEQRAEKIIFS